MNPNPKRYGQTMLTPADQYTLPPRKFTPPPNGFSAVPNKYEGTVYCRDEPLYPYEVIFMDDNEITVKNDHDKCFKMPRSWFCVKL